MYTRKCWYMYINYIFAGLINPMGSGIFISAANGTCDTQFSFFLLIFFSVLKACKKSHVYDLT